MFVFCFYLITEIGEKEVWERNMWLGLSKWSKDVKIRVPRVNAHQKVALAEKAFSNQVNKMAHGCITLF